MSRRDLLQRHRQEGLYTLVWSETSAATWLIERYIDHSVDLVEVD